MPDNQIKFAFWSDRLNIGFNSHRDCRIIIEGEDYVLPPKVNRGLLYFELPDKKLISYNLLKRSFTHANKSIILNPLPF
jgi:hypothetical protein